MMKCNQQTSIKLKNSWQCIIISDSFSHASWCWNVANKQMSWQSKLGQWDNKNVAIQKNKNKTKTAAITSDSFSGAFGRRNEVSEPVSNAMFRVNLSHACGLIKRGQWTYFKPNNSQ